MIIVESPIQKTHYEILSVNEEATYEQIRACYRSSILSFHPDKLGKPSTASDPNHPFPDRFLKVQKAWEVLGSARSRAVYDSELRARRLEAEAAEEDVSLEDMTVEDEGEVLSFIHQCRCGDYFSVDSLELGEMGHPISRDEGGIFVQARDDKEASVLLPCGSCSLKVRLLIDASLRLPNGVGL